MKVLPWQQQGIHTQTFTFKQILIYFQESHQIWLNYLSPCLSHGQKSLSVVPPQGSIGLKEDTTMYPERCVVIKIKVFQ